MFWMGGESNVIWILWHQIFTLTQAPDSLAVSNDTIPPNFIMTYHTKFRRVLWGKLPQRVYRFQSKALEKVGMYILPLFTNFIAKARPSCLISVTQIEKKNRAEHLRERSALNAWAGWFVFFPEPELRDTWCSSQLLITGVNTDKVTAW